MNTLCKITIQVAGKLLLRIAIVLLVPLVLLPQLLTVPVTASSGLLVQGTSLTAEVKPGDLITHKITIILGTEEPPTDVSVSLEELGISPEGMVMPLINKVNSFSACDFIILDKTFLSLDPGKPRDILVKIEVPADIGEGSRYALISIKTIVTGGADLNIASAVNIPIYLTLKGTHLVHTGRITGITFGKIISGKPVNIITDFENTGNHYFKVNNEVTVSDSNGKVIDKITTGLTKSSTIPGTSRVLSAQFTPPYILPPGTYNVNSRVMLADGTVLDDSSGIFTIEDNTEPSSSPLTQPFLSSTTPAQQPASNTPSANLDTVTADHAPIITTTIPSSATVISPQTRTVTFLMNTMIISPANARPGQPVTISIPVTNLSPENSDLQLTLSINGVIEEEKGLILKAGESRTAYFVTSQKEPGNYIIDISGMPGEFRISGTAVREWSWWWLGAGAFVLLTAAFFLVRHSLTHHE